MLKVFLIANLVNGHGEQFQSVNGEMMWLKYKRYRATKIKHSLGELLKLQCTSSINVADVKIHQIVT